MIADFIITIVTSTPVLIGLPVLAVAARVLAFLHLIPDPYRALARPAAAVAVLLAAFLFGHRMADERAEMTRTRTDLAFAQAQLENQKATAEQASRLKAAAEARASELETKVADYETKLSVAPAGACTLDDDDARRLRDIR